MPMRPSGELVPIAFAKMTEAALAAAAVRSAAEADALISSVLAYAEQWHAGTRSLADVRTTFTAQERFLAGRFVRPHPPALAALFEALAAESGVVFDRSGRSYPEPDAPGLGRTVRYEAGLPIATFTADPSLVTRRHDRAGARHGRSHDLGDDRSELAKRAAWRVALPEAAGGRR